MATIVHYYLYAVSSPHYYGQSLFKLGCTRKPRERLDTYLTGCPPGQEPSADLQFYGLWELQSTCVEDMFDCEDRLHDYFLESRKYREHLGDSEWFGFTSMTDGNQTINAIRSYLRAQPWIKRELSPDEIDHITRSYQATMEPSKFLQQFVHQNFAIIRDDKLHRDALTAIQRPIIAQIRAFMTNREQRATYFVAPCGSGKTVIVAEGIRRTNHVIICVPNEQIQKQWAHTLISRNVFGIDTRAHIYFIGNRGTTNPETIAGIISNGNRIFCLITTYMSSELLIPHIAQMDVIVLDEAHHLAGIVSEDGEGIGKTRTFMDQAIKLNAKRLSLTFTPRIIRRSISGQDLHQDESARFAQPQHQPQHQPQPQPPPPHHLSMDSADQFGTLMTEISLRDLIKRGILPDYYIWVLNGIQSIQIDHRPDSRSISAQDSAPGLAPDPRSELAPGLAPGLAQDVESRAYCILDAWRATKMVRKSHDLRDMNQYHVLTHTLNHLIIFAQTVAEANAYEAFFAQHTQDTVVLCATSGQSITKILEKFQMAPRAIIINCFMLGEGVDIPCADSVAITYPKQSRGQITQMILRAGRWYYGKGLFHILIPIIKAEEDLSALEEVLASLATCDSALRDEIIEGKTLQTASLAQSMAQFAAQYSHLQHERNDTIHHRIILDLFKSIEIDHVRAHLSNVRRAILIRAQTHEILEICTSRKIDTSIGYTNLRRTKMPDLPEDPRFAGQMWYDFFHPTISRITRPRVEDFARDILIPNDIHSSEQYDAWYHTLSVGHTTPSLQYIADGYFGPEYTGFMDIAQLGVQIVPRRR